MADKNVSDPPTIIPKTTKPASEALLNEKVRSHVMVKEKKKKKKKRILTDALFWRKKGI